MERSSARGVDDRELLVLAHCIFETWYLWISTFDENNNFKDDQHDRNDFNHGTSCCSRVKF